jgi:hypothetical protein
MAFLAGPVGKLRQLALECEGRSVDPGLFRETGLFILRGIFSENFMVQYRALMCEIGVLSQARNKFNAVDIQTDNSQLRALAKHPALSGEINRIFGDNIALYGFRFVVKDAVNSGAVFPHNDIGYHLGFMRRCSAFVAITDCSASNGGMEFFPGTHNFGLLADAGHINLDVLCPNWPTVAPDLKSGDVVLMNSSLWHRSGENISGADRILADIHYQPADDPSGLELITGQWQTEYRIPRELLGQLFVRSRVSRLKQLEAELAILKG